jgi:AcrR family transcriptional regulator
LNYYYKNKDGLFTEVVKMMMQQYLHEVEDNLKSTTNTKDKVNSLVRYFSELIRKNPELLKLFIDFTAQSLWLPSFRGQLKELFADLSEMIEKKILAGSTINRNLSEYSLKSVAKLVLGALYGTSIQIMLDSDDDIESLSLVGIILN